MSFSDNHIQHLQSLPLALQEGTVQYDKLKGLIPRIVDELSENGFSPQILRDVISAKVPGDSQDTRGASEADNPNPETTQLEHGVLKRPRVTYELTSSESGQLTSHLRVWTSSNPDLPNTEEKLDSALGARGSASDCTIIPPLLRTAVTGVSSPMGMGKSHQQSGTLQPNSDLPKEVQVATTVTDSEVEVAIPLVQDGEFFTILAHNLEDISSQLKKSQSVFSEAVADLAKSIEDVCQPASVAANFHPYSGVSTRPNSVEVKANRMKSDLYAWREIFLLYAESDIFERNTEGALCNWSLDECEKRLKTFVEKAGQQWLPEHRKTKDQRLVKGDTKFQYKQSTGALETFIKLNLQVLEIKKFSFVNAEAITNLLRTRVECCALPTPCQLAASGSASESSSPLTVDLHAPFQHSSFLIIDTLTPSVIKPFLHSMNTTLFPVIPAVDDYACVICTCIAFKPVRLTCSHLFCVRCLMKMQRKREGNCPMCRAPSVLKANAANVDWALLNFMEDWFPRESREKLKANEKEVAAEISSQWKSQDNSCRIS